MNLSRSMKVLDFLLERALALLMLALVLSVSWQVASHYLLQAPSSWTEELARFLLVWIGLLGAAYAYRIHAHVGVDVLARKAGPVGQRYLRVLAAAMVLLFAGAVMVLGGVQLVMLTAELEQLSAALGLPMAAVYLVIPLSGLLIAIYALHEMATALRESTQCHS